MDKGYTSTTGRTAPRPNLLYSTPYELHKKLINHYVLNKRGATALLQRDTSRDRRDIDVIRENHKFVWEEDDEASTWEQKLAKKYYDKLFKEYCISDLSRYKENKFAMRWQTEGEMVSGKGQFVCGSKNCLEKQELRSWEVNFAYIEHGEKRNALVKLRLCCKCSDKLNYHHKRKEVKRGRKEDKVGKRLHKTRSPSSSSSDPQDRVSASSNDTDSSDTLLLPQDKELQPVEDNIWKQPLEEPETLSREDEFEKYLEELLL